MKDSCIGMIIPHLTFIGTSTAGINKFAKDRDRPSVLNVERRSHDATSQRGSLSHVMVTLDQGQVTFSTDRFMRRGACTGFTVQLHFLAAHRE